MSVFRWPLGISYHSSPLHTLLPGNTPHCWLYPAMSCAPSPQAHPPHPHSSPISPLVTNQSSDLGMMSSIKEAHHWLAAHYFSSYLSLFASYNGADLLRLSRRDLVELCGPADGIRLFNALRSRTLRTVYVCLEGKTGRPTATVLYITSVACAPSQCTRLSV